MDCKCGGILKEGKSCYREGKDNFLIILENIPAFQCMRCVRVLFTDETVDRIRKLVNRIERESNEIVTGRPSVRSSDF